MRLFLGVADGMLSFESVGLTEMGSKEANVLYTTS